MFRKRRCMAFVAATVGMLLAVPQTAEASVGGGNVSIDWSVPGAPSAGLEDITFPITVNPDTAHQVGTYFAQQFSFQENVAGYTGLQPRLNKDGKERLRGVFSLFGAGATTSDPNCHSGADGGDGVSCGVEFDAIYGHTYHLTVKRTGPNTWTGTARDTTTGSTVHIGSYTVPAGSGSIEPSQGGFVEYYAGVASCSTMPRSDVIFGGPTSTASGGLSGTSRANYEYSDCVGESNYQAQQVGNGTHVTRGYLSGPPFDLVSSASGRCLDANGRNNGDLVSIWDCHGGENQQWLLSPEGHLLNNFGCLDAQDHGTTPGTPVRNWECNGGRNQQWKINSDGSVTGVESDLCLGVTGGSTVNGATVELQTCNGSSTQKW